MFVIVIFLEVQLQSIKRKKEFQRIQLMCILVYMNIYFNHLLLIFYLINKDNTKLNGIVKYNGIDDLLYLLHVKENNQL